MRIAAVAATTVATAILTGHAAGQTSRRNAQPDRPESVGALPHPAEPELVPPSTAPERNPSEAASKSDALRLGDVCLGLLIPFPECTRTLHFDLGLASQKSSSEVGWQTYARGFAEVGVLLAIEPGSPFHVGPVTEIGFDLGEDSSGWHLTPKLMGRLWIASFLTLDGSIGVTFARTTLPDPGFYTETRIGDHAAVALTVHGALGIFAATEQLFDAERQERVQHRFLLGIRGTVGFWGSLLYLASGGK
jgi:hypothetical protein